MRKKMDLVLTGTLRLRGNRALSHCSSGWDTGQVGAHCSEAWVIVFKSVWTPSGTSSLPRKTPLKPLENHIFTFSKPLLQWGKTPTVTSLLQRKHVLSTELCLLMPPASCTLPFPLLNSSAPSCPDSFILLHFLVPLLFLFGGVHFGHCFQVLDYSSAHPEWGASAWQPQWGLLCCLPKQLCATRHLD